MTREEAIKELRGFIGQLTEGCQEVIKVLIPELRESDDERIRKEIIDYLGLVGKGDGDYAQPMIDRWIAYLEKQKEQKPPITGNDFGWIDELKHDLEHPEELDQKVDDVLKQRKGIRALEWSDTDTIGWDEAFACVTRTEKSAKNEEELQNAVTAEKWLKEIKFKYYAHPVKQGWSEEDELNCNRIIRFLEPHKTFFPMKETKEEMQNWLKNRLKSLRPQYHGDVTMTEAYKMGKEAGEASRWKPSEEQMDALAYAIQLLDDGLSPKAAKAGEELEHFREQLKKL